MKRIIIFFALFVISFSPQISRADDPPRQFDLRDFDGENYEPRSQHAS